MALEKRPQHPLRPGPRPGSRTPPHTVGNDETLESVAHQYGISVEVLIWHNFQTYDAREINWYLRHRVGCTLETRDGKNMRFSASAKPGLIYIPMRVIHGPPIYVIGQTGKVPAPVDISGAFPPEIPMGMKWSFPFKYPEEPRDSGPLRWQITGSVEGEIKDIGARGKISLTTKQVKLSVEDAFIKNLELGLKIEDKTVEPLADAVRKLDVTGFGKALAGLFEASYKMRFRAAKHSSCVFEPGLQFAEITAPVVLKLSFEFDEFPLTLEGVHCKAKLAFKGGANLGPSLALWKKIVDKVGRKAVEEFLKRTWKATLDWLADEAVLDAIVIGTSVAVAVAGTLGLVALTSWITGDARRKGELLGLSTWYSGAYAGQIFGGFAPPDTDYGFTPDQLKMRTDLIAAGRRDAVDDARKALAARNDPAARGSEFQVLQAWREVLIAQSNGSSDTAKARLRQAIDEKAKQIVGL
jgi:hypothetical protein